MRARVKMALAAVAIAALAGGLVYVIVAIVAPIVCYLKSGCVL